MAVWNFEDFEAGPAEAGGQVQRAAHLAGAAVSLALVIGVAVWGYRLAMRDVHGIPVIEAMSGPMRIAPEDPGGQIAGNVGLSVNRVAAGDGTAEAPPDGKVTLAPQAMGLSEADVSPEARQSALDAARAAAQAQAEAQAAAAAAAPDPAAQDATANAMAAGGSPAAPAPADAPAQDSQVAVTIEGTSTIPGGPPVRSLAPEPRPAVLAAAAPAADAAASSSDVMPADVAAAAAAAAAAVARAPAPASVDASSLPAGTWLVQLGAFPDSRDAVKDWGALQSRFADLLADKSRVVQKAEAGGRSFYRLRATGFSDGAEARRFCAALSAEGASCVPVRLR